MTRTPKSSQSKHEEFLTAVTSGRGLMPWQESGLSEEENAFRQRMEERKTGLIRNAMEVSHPVLCSEKDIARAKRRVMEEKHAQAWYDELIGFSDFITSRDAHWLDSIVPQLTPWSRYGFTCPHCMGRLSMEGHGHGIIEWDFRNPDQITCRKCRHVYPSELYPETRNLQVPRMGQTLTFYEPPRERANPDDRSGDQGYHWLGHPYHLSFTGMVRTYKAHFCATAPHRLAMAHALTGKDEYARAATEIMRLMSKRFPAWLYHDYWHAVADCDPLYAAWHDGHFQPGLRLEWKRHLSTSVYKDDSFEHGARMEQSYWGAGRVGETTGGSYYLPLVLRAYDLLCHATDRAGKRFLSDAENEAILRNYILEFILETEPFIGGEGKANCVNNMAPRIYLSMATAANVLNAPAFMDVALRGYEGIRDCSFLPDGTSNESPNYTQMFLALLLQVTEELDGYVWPEPYAARKGTISLYKTDPKLKAMVAGFIGQLRSNLFFIPHSDTHLAQSLSSFIAEVGRKHYPAQFEGLLPGLYRMEHEEDDHQPEDVMFNPQDAVFRFDSEPVNLDVHFSQEETVFPAWMTAILRHGSAPGDTTLSLADNPAGGHRHQDNLTLFYETRNRIMLGDFAYMGSDPRHGWFYATHSHNLVLVDDASQEIETEGRKRTPAFRMAFTSPLVSVVEAESDAYRQCDLYRRRVALFKGPYGRSFVLDLFRVRGGASHAYQIFSEIGASDADEPSLTLNGINLPPVPPYPDYGASTQFECISGLRDLVKGAAGEPGWQALWGQNDENGKREQYRLTILSDCDTVEVAHSPAMETRDMPPSRRVRFVRAIRKAQEGTTNLDSLFVALHEPGIGGEDFPVRNVRRLDAPPAAGADAMALVIETEWGTYHVFANFETEVELDGFTFNGDFGAVLRRPDGSRALAASGASTLIQEAFGFRNAPSVWHAEAMRKDDHTLKIASSMPNEFPGIPQGCANYAITDIAFENQTLQTAYAIDAIADTSVKVKRFALTDTLDGKARRFYLPALQYRTN